MRRAIEGRGKDEGVMACGVGGGVVSVVESLLAFLPECPLQSG